MADSITACSKAKIESRLEVLLVSSVMDVLREDVVGLVKTREAALMDVLREDIVGLVKTREAAPEASDKALGFPSPVGDTANPSIVFRRRSNGIMGSFKWSSDSSPSSANEQRVFGLMGGDAMNPLSLQSRRSIEELGTRVSETLLWLVPNSSKSTGVFAGGGLSVCAQFGSGEEYGGNEVRVPDRIGGLQDNVAE